MKRSVLSRTLCALIIGLGSSTAAAAGGGKLALYKPESPWSDPPYDVIAVIDDVDQPVPRVLTNPPDFTIDSSPSWSPGGKQLIFQRYKGETDISAIYRVNVDGSGLTQVLSSQHDTYGPPKWGPRGTGLIAFVTHRSAKDCVTVMAPNGSGRRDVICPTGSGGSRRSISELQWFPNGKQVLVCTSRQNTPSNLRRVNIATGASRLLLSSAKCPARSSIASDGKQLAVELDGSVYLLDATTGSRRFLTYGTSPVFSPDGKRVAFSRKHGDDYYPVFIVDVDGTHLDQVTPPNQGRYLSQAPLQWSADGSRILVAEAADYGADFLNYSFALLRTSGGASSFVADDRAYELSLPNPWFEE